MDGNLLGVADQEAERRLVVENGSGSLRCAHTHKHDNGTDPSPPPLPPSDSEKLI